MDLILASQSPRRRQLLIEAGYEFTVDPPSEQAECGMCSGESPPEMVARLAWQKARDVKTRVQAGIVIGCDTVAECHGTVLGKPIDREHASQMLRLLRGKPHRVFSGLCLWRRPDDKTDVRVAVTKLHMDAIDDGQLDQYLNSEQWLGKAGAFGYQDGLDWVHVDEGSQSNVVGLPLELLAEMLGQFGEDPA